MATLSLKKASLVTRGHHVEVVAVGPHKIGYRASLRGLTFISPLWGHTLLHLMATLSLEKVSLVTRGHHEEVVAVSSHA